MMEKRLKKYTMIPEHLYVSRSADEQLKNIVNEMQRPGYVLVARQMGKTNLLLNAKRTLENENRLFVYIDLSNVFEYERDCYRNIIDNIIETNENLFESFKLKIYDLRTKSLPPHKEYSTSLRMILQQFEGNLIIILDEVDALRSADYSDNIFAQIRSNYFLRTSFHEFERLTYILSGVLEPRELIKDRNKSPFNIGDKIYLDDFTKEEHNAFISKSGLNLEARISDNIYAWANGNPRLTFDICSEVESFIMDHANITDEDLEKLIKKKYLATFDIAPVDHIRELVKSDKKVRNAVLRIQQGKANSISDEIKMKLYLYGIINLGSHGEIYIKNRIIKLCLTEEWIREVDKQKGNNFTDALTQFSNNEYSNTIETLLEFLKTSNPNKTDTEISNYYIGFSYYHLKNYQKAVEYFGKSFGEEPYKSNSKSLLGICKLGLGDKEDGIAILEEAILKETNDFSYHNALLNLAMNLEHNEDGKAFLLYEKLYDSTFLSEDGEGEDLNQFRTLALYYQGEILLRKKDIESAIDKLLLAEKYADIAGSLYLKYLQYTFGEHKDEQVKSTIVKTIIEQNLKFDTVNSYQISFNENHLIAYLGFVFDPSDIELFESLLNYSGKELYGAKLNKFSMAYLSSQNSSKKESILNYLLGFKQSIGNDLLVKIYRDLSIIHSNEQSSFFRYFNEYLHFFKQTNIIISYDIYIFTVGIKHYSDLHNIKKGLELCEAIEARVDDIEDESLKFEFIIIYYWYSTLNFSVKNRSKSIQYAEKTLQMIKKDRRMTSSMIDEEGLKSITLQMEQIKDSSIVRKPIVRKVKYGRNEKIEVEYLNGRLVENKYKRLEADILAERCKIISRVEYTIGVKSGLDP